MDSSKLDRRITIQVKASKRDSAGYPIPNSSEWKDVTTIWAGRLPLRGREFFAAAAVQHEKTTRFKIRYRDDIKAGMRVVEKGRSYEIYAVLDDAKGDRTETHLMTTTTEKTNG